MGDFKFSFDVVEDEEVNVVQSAPRDRDPVIDESAQSEPTKLEMDETIPTWREAKEIHISDASNEHTEKRVLSFACDDLKLSYLHHEDVETSIQGMQSNCGPHQDIKEALSSHSDLVPCVYEGGLKVWECSLDLTCYLSDELGNGSLYGRSVLELGCGAGLPGIYAMMKGATVDFQDYNEEVIRLLTIPNVRLNTSQESITERCRFFGGDWSLVEEVLAGEGRRYDVILTSETIYSLDSQPRLYSIIKRLLKPSGNIYLAAKTHYFGVGGGTRQFEDFVREKGEFSIKPCKVISQGVQREILRMRFLQEDDAKT